MHKGYTVAVVMRGIVSKHMLGLLVAGAVVVAGALFVSTNSADAAINPQINFQGKLTNPDGTNVTNGSYSIVFSIYTVASGGTAVWTETQNPVTITDGIFQVSLGSVTSLPGSVDFNSASLYLGIKVGADPEMSPRVRLTAAPYAFNSDRLGGVTSDGFVQLGQSATAQTDASTNSSIFINKTAAGNLLQLQASSTNRLTLSSAGALTLAGSISTSGGAVSLTGNAASSITTTSGALTLTGAAASTWSTTAGNLTIQAGSGTISLGSSTVLSANGTLAINSGAGTALTIDSGTTGAINLGTSANAKTIAIGNVTGATSITNNVGNSTSAFNIQGPSSAIYMRIDSANNRLQIGSPTADGTGFLLVLDSKNTTGDPTGVNGAMYYNSADNDFRAYQNSQWTNIQPVRYAYLATDVTRAATSYADVTGLSFTVAANTDYEMVCNLIYRSAATGTGIGFALNGPGSPGLVAGQFISNSTATAFNGRSFNAYNGTGKTTGVQTANADTFGLFRAYFRNGNNAGTLQLRFASENTTTVTVRANSYCRLAEL